MTAETAVTPVESADVAGSVATAASGGGMHVADLSMLGMFMQADFVVKSVILILLAFSIFSWAIIVDKWMRFKALKFQSSRFEKEFWSGGAIDKFYEKVKKRSHHPLAHVFIAGMDEWYRSRKQANSPNAGIRAGVTDRVSQMMQITKNREIYKLERGLGFLGTVGSASPFIGLFGTVWGIMNSFTSIAISKNTTLAVVAPGIAEALLATAIGLFAAIPAVVGYNRYSGELDRLIGRIEDFSSEFVTLLARQLDNDGSR